VEEQLKKPKLKSLIRKLNKKVADQEQTLQSSTEESKSEIPTEAAFTSYETLYLLYNSFILDSGATTYVNFWCSRSVKSELLDSLAK
jgi:hypothetical protein